MTDRDASDPAPEFALDASVTLAWFFEDESNPYADAVAARLPECRAVVPSIWPLEIANALLVGERRGRATQAESTRWLGMLAALPIDVDQADSRSAFGDTLAKPVPYGCRHSRTHL